MEAQALMQQARELLASRNAPITAENLNRAMLMLTGSGDTMTEQTAEGFDMNAQVDRVLQRSGAGTQRRANVPRNAQPNTPVGNTVTTPTAASTSTPATATTPSGGIGFAETVPPIAPQVGQMPTGPIPEEPAVMGSNPYQPTRSERVAMSPEANVRRRGTINAAQPIAEDDPLGGIFEGNQPRQAVDVDNPTGLALGLMTAPLGAVARGATMAPTLGQRAYSVVQADRAARAAQTAREATRATQRGLADQARTATRANNPSANKVDRVRNLLRERAGNASN